MTTQEPRSKRPQAIALASLIILLGLLVWILTSGGSSPTDLDTTAPTGQDPATTDSSTTAALPNPPITDDTTVETAPPTSLLPVSPRPFADSSPFNQPIPANPTIDPSSNSIVAGLTEDVVAALYEFGIAIYEAADDTEPVSVLCTQNWGRCPLESGLHRIPADAEPAPGSDGTIAAIDWLENRTIEMWQPEQQSDGSWITSWGTTSPLDGSGIPDVFGNGAGASHLAGVIRVFEIQQGSIDHALVFSSTLTCQDEFRYPAVKTDGSSTAAACIPEGARVQLDPNVDLNTIPLTPAERTIAEALQEYGAYAIDSGGAPMALYFEIADDASWENPGSIYTATGLAYDYYALDAIPWEHLRVLSNWDGS